MFRGNRLILFKCIFGSHLYGNSTIDSDIDYKVIVMPNMGDILLGNTDFHLSEGTKKSSFGVKNTSDDVDEDVISIQRYLKMLSRGQTNALEIFFASSSLNATVYKHPLWDNILSNRGGLLSKNYNASIGYMTSQIDKYIYKGEKFSAINKFIQFLDELPYDIGNQRLVEYEDLIQREFIDIGVKYIEWWYNTKLDKHLSVCGKKYSINCNMVDVIDGYKKLYNQYGNRSKESMDSDNIDWKAVSHAVRIGEQFLEFLNTGNIIFPRPNSNELLDIKTGKVQFSTIKEHIGDLYGRIEQAYNNSSLPPEVDNKYVDNLVKHVHECYISEQLSEQLHERVL